uniref:sugar transferase n=1 Tax=Ornithobacterium rhinotracheale TaxID=28251 RepID=UPI0039A6F4DF
MIRFFDFTFAFFGLLILSPIILIIYLLGLFDTGHPIFLQERVGKDKKPFKICKFRTMKLSTDSVATHLADSSSVTKYGKFLRKTKLDELPQLFNVLKGDMSLVGARPNLFNQNQLIEERDKLGVYNHKPGITGLAQIREIDMSTPEKLSKLDAKMYETLNLKNYFKYIFATLSGKGQGDRIQKEENE